MKLNAGEEGDFSSNRNGSLRRAFERGRLKGAGQGSGGERDRKQGLITGIDSLAEDA